MLSDPILKLRLEEGFNINGKGSENLVQTNVRTHKKKTASGAQPNA